MKTALDFRNTWKKRLLPLGGMLLVLVFVCMLSGCKDVRKMSSPQADTAGTAYEVTDVQGTVVSLPEKPSCSDSSRPIIWWPSTVCSTTL